MAGSAAAGAAATTASIAGTVQITHTGSETSLQAGGILNPDISGDGITDLDGLSVKSISMPYQFLGMFMGSARYGLSATFDKPGSSSYKIAAARYTFFRFSVSAANVIYYASAAGSLENSSTAQDATAFLPVTFNDSRINGGTATNALLQVRSFNDSKTEHTIQFLRTVFDDASPAEPAAEIETMYPEFDPNADDAAKAALKSKLTRSAKKLKKKIKKVKKSGNTTKAKKLNKKLKKLKKQLKTL